MAARATWKGYLRLSLVSVPVKAYTANESSSEIRLNQLHAECHSPIKYQKVCPIHGELSSGEIVSGYQYTKGQYVVVDPKEIEKLRKKSDKAIDLDQFFPLDTIDPVYLSGRNYYLVPDGPIAQKAFVLLREAMARGKLAAAAQVVLSSKEQLVLLRPEGKLLVMSPLDYEAQVRLPSQFESEVADSSYSEDEVALTETLVKATTADRFDASRYKSSYNEQLTELIEAKVAGREIVAAPDAEEPRVIELLDALRESVARAQAARDDEADAPASTRKKTAKKSGERRVAKSAAKKTPAASKSSRKKKSG